jgi:hypothetical protein
MIGSHPPLAPTHQLHLHRIPIESPLVREGKLVVDVGEKDVAKQLTQTLTLSRNLT